MSKKNRTKHFNQSKEKSMSQESTQETQNQSDESVTSSPVVIEKTSVATTTEESKVSENTTQVVFTPVTSAPQPESFNFEEFIKKFKTEYDITVSSAIQFLENYVLTMAPRKPIEANIGNQFQVNFYRMLTSLGTLDKQVFDRVWSVVLLFFKQYAEGALAPRLVFRFAESWSLDEEQLTAFQNILNLCMVTADPAERKKAIRTVDLNRTLAAPIPESLREKVLAYYTK